MLTITLFFLNIPLDRDILSVARLTIFQLRPSISSCNDPTIGSYNDYHLSPNGISSGNQRWYGLIYLVYKRLVNRGQGSWDNRVALSTLLGRVTFEE